MQKKWISLGLMSGTSGDGVDVSIIKSDGESKYKLILDKYFNYGPEISDKIYKIREKINNSKDLENFSKDLEFIEEKITLFHAKAIEKIIKENEIDLIGFHGQTIFHRSLYAKATIIQKLL